MENIHNTSLEAKGYRNATSVYRATVGVLFISTAGTGFLCLSCVVIGFIAVMQSTDGAVNGTSRSFLLVKSVPILSLFTIYLKALI